MNLDRSLSVARVCKTKWYYDNVLRDVKVDPLVSMQIKKIAAERPTYGSRRMVDAISKELKIPTNHKKIQRIFRKLGQD